MFLTIDQPHLPSELRTASQASLNFKNTGVSTPGHPHASCPGAGLLDAMICRCVNASTCQGLDGGPFDALTRQRVHASTCRRVGGSARRHVDSSTRRPIDASSHRRVLVRYPWMSILIPIDIGRHRSIKILLSISVEIQGSMNMAMFIL